MESAALGSGVAGKTKEGGSSTDERILNFTEGHNGEEVKGKGGEEDWLATHLDGELFGNQSNWSYLTIDLALLFHLSDESASAHVADIADIPDSEPPAGANSMTAGEEDDLAAKVAGTSIGVPGKSEARTGRGDGPSDMGDIPDMDDEEDDELGGLGEGVEEADDPATLASRQAAAATANTANSQNRLVSVRTYDCLITYDKYYQTPRMWLVGYNESGQPLKPAEIFEDISSDYAQKTVTVEPFPHSNMSTASIHPCKHASVMKKVIERMNAGVVEEQRKAKAAAGGESEKKKKKTWGLGGAMKKVTGKESEGGSSPSTEPTEEESTEVEGLRVDQYLLIFLKFMASIVPAIEIDATQAV